MLCPSPAEETGMSGAIHNSLPVSSLLPERSGSNQAPAQNPQPERQKPASVADAVTLTEAQHVYQLYDQGRTVSQIAFTLKLPVETVNSFLGISAANPAGEPLIAALNSANAAAQASTSNLAKAETLSQAQQVYQLYNHGETVSQIATTLDLSVAAVNGYLGISKTS
jgi:DNA-binding NarL/FixJ family response regulator